MSGRRKYYCSLYINTIAIVVTYKVKENLSPTPLGATTLGKENCRKKGNKLY